MPRFKTVLEQILGAAILLAFLAGLLLVLTVPFEMARLAKARTWPSRRGIVTQSSASRIYRRGGTYRWAFVIRGSFLDGPETFTLTRVRYGDLTIWNREAYCRSVVARYPAGREVDVYSSPANPRERILEPHASLDRLWAAFGAGLGLVSLPGILFLFRKRGPAAPEDP